MSFRVRTTSSIICAIIVLTTVLVYLSFLRKNSEEIRYEVDQYIGVCGVRRWQVATSVNSNEHQNINTSPIMTELVSNKTISDCITHDTIIRNMAVGSPLKQHQLSPLRIDNRKGDKPTISREKQFIDVFRFRKWGERDDVTSSGLQVSGAGSTLLYAQEASAMLHTIINTLKYKLGKQIIRLLDIPCGDFQWMHRFLQTRNDILYTGMDIVPDLINRHQKTFKDCDQWKFVIQDASETNLNEMFDIILTRHVLQHLPNQDVLRILNNLSSSGSKYLLVTTFPEERANKNLDVPGDFRRLNLQIPPISLIPPLCLHKDGYLRDGGYLGLWELPLRRFEQCNESKISNYKLHESDFYTCI